MKNLLLLFSFLFLAFTANTQSSYTEAIQMGDRAVRNGQYKIALNKYFSAESFDPSKKEIVRQKVNIVFDRIERLRGEAEKAKADTQLALQKVEDALSETQKAKEVAQLALQKANKLVNAFYFYDEKFALAYGEKEAENTFYFIDKNGDEVQKLGKWKQAEQFDWMGFAKVKNWEYNKLKEYFLDTFGNTYSTSYSLKLIEFFPKTKVLDLSKNQYSELPARIFRFKNLEILYLQSNGLKHISSEIGELQKLTSLNLSHNLFVKLPPEIGQLTNLKILNLKSNQWLSLPPEIGNLKNLTRLNLSGLHLTSLLREIGKLENLAELHLSKNQLTYLPKEIRNLINLTYLDLRKNPISIEEQEKIKQLLPNCNIRF